MTQRVQVGEVRGVVRAAFGHVWGILFAIACIWFAGASSRELLRGRLWGKPTFSASLYDWAYFTFCVLAVDAIAAFFAWITIHWFRAYNSIDIEADGSWSLRNDLGMVVGRIPRGIPLQLDMKALDRMGGMGPTFYSIVINANGRKYASIRLDWSAVIERQMTLQNLYDASK